MQNVSPHFELFFYFRIILPSRAGNQEDVNAGYGPLAPIIILLPALLLSIPYL
jgi:hypothetical protein